MGRWLDESTFAGLVARLAQRGPNPPPLRDVREICKIAVSVLSREPNVLHLDSPLYVVGDIHGQFQDLLGAFSPLRLPMLQRAPTNARFTPSRG